MKTFKKVCMILISVTAVAGIGCIIAAFVMGADPRQIRNYAEGKTSGKLQTEERNIRADQIRKLNIDIGSGDVKLQNGNQDRLIIKKKGSWEPVILKSDGEIEIKQKSRHFKLFNQMMRSQLFCPKVLPLRKFPWIVAMETLHQIL